MYQFVLPHLCITSRKYELNVVTDEGNSQNEIGH